MEKAIYILKELFHTTRAEEPALAEFSAAYGSLWWPPAEWLREGQAAESKLCSWVVGEFADQRECRNM